MHLYIHIPFCHRICPYCSFYKHTPGKTDMKRFIDALLKEASLRLPGCPPVTTIYFGGGTPSMLSSTHLSRLVEGLGAYADISSVEEFSFEANPATFTAKKAELWRQLGITRISLGIQSWDPSFLAMLGRTHTPEQAKESIRLLRQAGIPQINVDLMFSLPKQTVDSWQKTLETTLEQNPDHISTYNLTYEEDTDFYRQHAAGLLESDEERDAAMFELAHGMLTGAGYRHYETSNYARNGDISLHNLAYWQGEDYIGLGPGAYSTVDRMRSFNTSDTTAYISALLEQNSVPAQQEHLDDAAYRTERIGLLLRTDTGLPNSWLRMEDRPLVAELIREHMAARQDNGNIVLTGRGRLLVDEIAVELID